MRFLAFVSSLIVALSTARAEPPVLTTIREVQALSRAEAEREPAVRLQAVVTMRYAYRHATYVHDGTGGIYLRLRRQDVPEGLAAGKLLEIEGVAAPGNFATEISGPKTTSAKVRIIGEAPLPEPRRVSPEEFMEPALSGQWIEIEAHLDDVQRRDEAFYFKGRTGDQAFSAVAPALSAGDAAEIWQLPGRRVRLCGVAGTVFNPQRQMIARLLYVQALTPLDEAPARTPAEWPLLPLGDLFRVDAPTPLSGIRVRGVVTVLRPGLGFHLRGESGAILVKTTRSDDVPPGAEVEVAGWPEMAPLRPFVRALQVTVRARREIPAPLRVPVKEVGTGRYQHEFVELEGEFLGVRRSARLVSYQIRQEGVIFSAQLKLPAPAPALAEIQPDSTVRVRGLLAGAPANPDETLQIGSDFVVLLADVGALQVIAVPPWWTVPRVLWLLAGVAVLAGLASAWVVLLRRRVAGQTGIIREQATREATEHERMRIAQNIHDDLGSRLTQLSLLGTRVMDAAETGPAADLGRRIAALARGTVATMDEIVWAVNPRYDTLQSLADYLCKLAPALLATGAVRCELDVPAVLPPRLIRPEIRHSLVLALREAVTNILKHARAAQVILALTFVGEEITITLSDDGCGLAADPVPEGRHGLANLRARLSAMHGECRIETRPDGGTRVVFRLPVAAVSHKDVREKAAAPGDEGRDATPRDRA